MKHLLKFGLIPLILMLGCATVVPYQGPPIAQIKQSITPCVKMDFQPTSVEPDSAMKEHGNCITDYQYRVIDSTKSFYCTGLAKGKGSPISFVFDILNETPIKYQTRMVPAVMSPSDVIPYTDQVSKGKSRVTISGPAPTGDMKFEIKAQSGLILGPYCWQTITNVE